MEKEENSQMYGIILMSYGGPESMDGIESFFTHILQGRKPSPEQLKPITAQYVALGTPDPLRTKTKRQAEALEYVLKQSGLSEVKVYPAYKHAAPFIEDTIGQMIEEGVTQIVTLPMTPFYTEKGVGQYQRTVQEELANRQQTIPVYHIDNWHLHPEYITVIASRVQEALNWLPQSAREESTIVFTAHSQPGTEEKHEVYVRQFTELAEQVALQLHVNNWRIAYRSARHKQNWLGPDIKDVVREEAETGSKGVVACELLSLTNNIETLQEIGKDCQDVASKVGIHYVRTEFLDDSFDLICALANITKEKLSRLELKV
ncbi:ferrochelatase [Peribacillus sp. NPDC096379]|uniref:ferrochelatase n=1 Tax=Peribacillus sp. NPDC096379 TaxID=3364393 RepID=UPI0037FE949A